MRCGRGPRWVNHPTRDVVNPASHLEIRPKVEARARPPDPDPQVYVFGSVATGLALPSSDVDLVVYLPPVRNLPPIEEAGILEGRNGIKESILQQVRLGAPFLAC